MNKWSRRAFIGVGTLLGGGLVLGTGAVILAPNRLSEKQPHQITTWMKITPDNQVTVLIPHADLGQGISTALAMMLADELEADWKHVTVEEAPALEIYANGYMAQLFGSGPTPPPAFLQRAMGFMMFKVAEHLPLQVTGGSASVRATGEMGMRVAGASAKRVLIEAAAARWNVAAETCSASLSRITHAASGRSVTFGEVASEAAVRTLPENPALKAFDQWRLMGQPIARFDVPAKTTGTAVYGIDTVLPNMLYATVRAAPVFGGKLIRVDEGPATAMPDVTKLIKLEGAVAVVANSYWTALKAVRAVKPVFSDGGHGAVSSASLAAEAASLLAAPAKPAYSAGQGAAALPQAARIITADYSVPFMAHATMEPPNATAQFEAGHLTLWTGVQDPLGARKAAADAAGLKLEQVTLNNHPLGGGFGRRLPGAFDYVEQASQIAMQMAPRPVKLIWSREEDIAHDFYRQAVLCRLEGGLDGAKNPLVWSSIFTHSADDGAAQFAYAIPHQSITPVSQPSHIRQGYWRSVDHSQHGFFVESFIDELAHEAGKDPFAFRRDLLPENSRHRAVLELAAAKAGWGTPVPPGFGRGIALVESFGSITCEVAEIEVTAEKKIKLHRVVAVVDCGDVVNPDTATAQIEGGILFGISACMFSNITIANGAVQQRNFYDFRVAHMADTPAIEVHFIASHARRGGIGEVGVPPIAAAIGNAVFAATGQRVRSLPLSV